MIRKIFLITLLLSLQIHAKETMMPSIYEIEVTSIDGTKTSLAPYKDKVMLIVNVASKCGFTPQYEGLEALYQKYKERGLVVLGFPCNQFGGQEPGTADEIGAFCERNYGVEFPMFEKIDVNGEGAHPLFKWLASEAPGLLGSKALKWNFTKFLVDRNGNVVSRHAPQDAPESLANEIDALLGQ